MARLTILASHISVIAGVGRRIASSHMLIAVDMAFGIIDRAKKTSTWLAPSARLGCNPETCRKAGPPRIRIAVPIAPMAKA